MVPKRIQLQRTKGWRMPEGAVSVARPTRWGNPFLVGSTGLSYNGVVNGDVGNYNNRTVHHDQTVPFALTAAQTVWLYERELQFLLGDDPELVDALDGLRGRDVACWCRLDEPCHADVLLRLANT